MSVTTQTARPPAETSNTLVYPIPGIHVDVSRLREDLRRMEEGFWTHQDRYKAGLKNWDGIALYSVSGDMHDLRCADRPLVHRTPAGDMCSYVSDQLLPQFGAPYLRVVFYRLRAGTHLGRHNDPGENRLTKGMIRVHIPVVTNDKVLMYVEGDPYHFGLGTAWYFDATAFHSVENRGDQDRIHLVVDLKLSRELRALLKPLTPADRLRLTGVALRRIRLLARTALRFARTAEGRARIKARARVVLGRPSAR